jgi:O-antigen ligase
MFLEVSERKKDSVKWITKELIVGAHSHLALSPIVSVLPPTHNLPCQAVRDNSIAEVDGRVFQLLIVAWGFCIPLVGVGSSGVLRSLSVLLVVKWLFFPEKSRSVFRKRCSVPPFLIVAGISCLFQSIVAFEPHTVSALSAFHSTFPGMNSVLQALLMPQLWHKSVEAFFYFTLLFLLFRFFSENPSAHRSALSGLLAGAIVASCLTLVVVTAPQWSVIHANRSSIWNRLGRISATFTDPNAFGLCAFLIGGVLYEEGARRMRLAGIFRVVGGVMLALGIFSGSRSYVLALLTCLLWILWTRWPKIRLPLVCGVGALLLVSNVPALLSWTATSLPTSFSRAFHSLSLHSAPDAWYSRFTFWRLALYAAQSMPLVGVGVGRFSQEVHGLATLHQIPLHGWVDNANSWYLTLLAEGGILGVASFFVSGWWFCRSGRPQCGISTLWCKIFAILLIFGPHLFFWEVGVTFILLGSQVYRYKGSPYSPLVGTLAVVGAIALHSLFFADERGVYGWQHDTSGWFRWSQKEASVYVMCGSSLHASGNPNEKVFLSHPFSSTVVARTRLCDHYSSRTSHCVDGTWLVPPKAMIEVPLECIGGSRRMSLKFSRVHVRTPRKKDDSPAFAPLIDVLRKREFGLIRRTWNRTYSRMLSPWRSRARAVKIYHSNGPHPRFPIV